MRIIFQDRNAGAKFMEWLALEGEELYKMWAQIQEAKSNAPDISYVYMEYDWSNNCIETRPGRFDLENNIDKEDLKRCLGSDFS